MSKHFRVQRHGIELYVRLTPKAHIDQIDGVETLDDGNSYLKARVRAIPEKGKANRALEKLIASHFGFPKSSIAVTRGTTSRTKTVTISGDPPQITAQLLR